MNFSCDGGGVSGYYTFLLNGTPVYEAPSKNLITDFGLNRLANAGFLDIASTGQCQVGTSNTPPAYTDTALGALLASKTGATASNGSGTDVNGNYRYVRASFAFAQGAVVGNVAEVGVKFASGDSSLSSRSLVKDGSGNPAIIVVTSIDQLTVVYEARYYRAAVDTTGTVTVAGVSTTYVFRTAQQIGNLSPVVLHGLLPDRLALVHGGTGSTLGAVGAAVGISGGLAAIAEGTNLTTKSSSVTGNTVTITFTTPVIGTSSGNTSGGVVCIELTPEDATAGNNALSSYSVMKASFSPAIAKTNTKTLTYSFTFTFTRF